MKYHQEEEELDREILVEMAVERLSSGKPPKGLKNSADGLISLRNACVRKVVEPLPLSSWLRRLRRDAGISLIDVASDLNQTSSVLEELESNSSVPWSIEPTVMVEVALLFRLHLDALKQLTQHSYDVAFFSGQLSNRESASVLMSNWLAEVQLELERRGCHDLLF